MKTEAARLSDIRQNLAAIAPGLWNRAHDSEGAFVEAVTRTGQRIEMARFTLEASHDEVEFVADAPSAMAFLLGLVDRAIAAARAAREAATTQDEREAKNFAAEAAMRCQDAAFKAFLAEQHGLDRPLTDERVAQKLRSLLGVTSRRDLNDNDAAAARWKAMRGDFENWKRAGR